MANEVSNGLHNAVPYHWEYADAAARTGATGFVTTDLGKWAHQIDDHSLWMLTATTPTWAPIGASGTLLAANNLSDLASAGTARASLGLGTAATHDVPASGDASSTQAVLGNDSRLTDSRPPTSHHTTHTTGGTDAIAPVDIGAAAASHTHTEGDISLSDVTTDNVSITKHGLAPKAPNDATRYLDGTGAYSVPAGSGLSGSGAAGQVGVWSGPSALTGEADLAWNGTNKTLSVTTTGGHPAVAANADTGIAFDGEASGAGGWGVYGYGGGAGGQGVVAEVGATDGIPLQGLAPSGQTADLLQLLVNSVVLFAVAPSGRPRFVSTPPSSATDTGATGEIAWDSTYLYVAVGTNTWKRTALSTW